MYWSPNFLAVVFKKQEIHSKYAIQCSLQYLFIMDQNDVLHAIYMFHNFHLIGYWLLVLTTRGATTAEKLKFWN